MDSMPKVSVVITTYNYGHYVAGAIRSVLEQTLRQLELIVVDDGSNDDTEAVVMPFLVDDRVRFVRTENRGTSAALNTGIALSQAPLVAFLDADDLWLPEKLEKQLALFEADPDLGVVYCRRYLIDPSGFELKYAQPALFRGHVLEEIFQDNFVCFSTAMVSRHAFESAGVLDEKWRQVLDYDLWLRLAARFRFDYVDEPLVLYRRGHGSLTQRGSPLVSALKIRDEFLARQGGRGPISRRAVRRSYALACTSLGFSWRRSAPLSALALFTRAIVLYPASIEAWLGLGGLLPFPASLRRRVRMLLGRPVDAPPRTGRLIGTGPVPLPGPSSDPGGERDGAGARSDGHRTSHPGRDPEMVGTSCSRIAGGCRL